MCSKRTRQKTVISAPPRYRYRFLALPRAIRPDVIYGRLTLSADPLLRVLPIFSLSVSLARRPVIFDADDNDLSVNGRFFGRNADKRSLAPLDRRRERASRASDRSIDSNVFRVTRESDGRIFADGANCEGEGRRGRASRIDLTP